MLEFDAGEELVTSALPAGETDVVAVSSSVHLASVDRIVALFSSDKPPSCWKPSGAELQDPLRNPSHSVKFPSGVETMAPSKDALQDDPAKYSKNMRRFSPDPLHRNR